MLHICLVAACAFSPVSQEPHASGAPEPPATEPAKVLVYTHSAGFVHDVVRRPEAGADSLVERTLRELAASDPRWRARVSRDPASFDPGALEELDAVLFFTTGELPLSDERRRALLAFVRAGGAFVGVHSATDTFYEFEPYLEMVGATFDGHPWHERVRVVVEDREHPATRQLGGSFEIVDEIYQFRAPYERSGLRVLLRLDVAGLDLQRPEVHRTDGDFALAWCRDYGRGRVFYTALGHRPEVWADERFREHLVGGLLWAARHPSVAEPAGGPARRENPTKR